MHDKITRATILIARLLDSAPRNHVYRLRLLSKVSKLIAAITIEEVRAATSEAKGDEAKLTWDQIAQCLEMSKSAAFTKYSGKAKSGQSKAVS